MADDLFIKAPFAKALQGLRSKPGSAGRFAAGQGLIGVAVEFDKAGALRDPLGQFTSLQDRVATANAKLAVELAEYTAKAAKASMRRPRVSSGRLQTALLHRENRGSNKIGFGVGRPEFLDKSDAKYWRQIDQGYKGHVGREIKGVFGNRKGPFTGMGKYGPYMIPTGQFTGIGAGAPIGKLYPLGKKSAYRLLAVSKRSGRLRNRPRVKSIIENPIDPQQYFKRGWEDFNAKKRVVEVVADEVAATFGGTRGGRSPSAGKRSR